MIQVLKALYHGEATEPCTRWGKASLINSHEVSERGEKTNSLLSNIVHRHAYNDKQGNKERSLKAAPSTECSPKEIKAWKIRNAGSVG